jgi:hypothetical protein
LGAAVELRYLEAPVEVLSERLCTRQADGAWPARPITRSELDGWVELFDASGGREGAVGVEVSDGPGAAVADHVAPVGAQGPVVAAGDDLVTDVEPERPGEQVTAGGV